MFKITGKRIYEDRKDKYPHYQKPYEGQYEILNKLKFDKVKYLIKMIPAELNNSENQVYGQPYAGNWGGLYFEYCKNGKRQFWLIDQSKINNPVFLNDFVDEINKCISLINSP